MAELPLHPNRVESALSEMRAVGVTEVVKSELGQTGTIELGGVRRFVESDVFDAFGGQGAALRGAARCCKVLQRAARRRGIGSTAPRG
jgi:hypothetical protein